MSVLYVQEQGACIHKAGGRLLVKKQGSTLGYAHLRDLDRLVLVGAVEVSTPAMAALLDGGIDMVLLSAGGRLRGRLAARESKNVDLRHTQFQRYEETGFRLAMARTIVAGKIRNARFLVQRFGRNHAEVDVEAAVAALDRSRHRLDDQSDAAAVLGVEGDAARVYFEAFGRMLLGGFTFTVRSRRPPRDPANALLSFGYAVLEGEVTAALAGEGLDPTVGMLHELDYGRPSLSLDLLEEFRQPVVDRLVLSLVNRRVLREEHFEAGSEGGVRMNDAGRPLFIEFYHRAMASEFEDRTAGERTTFTGIIRRQARRMRLALADGSAYEPFGQR
ncbi:MAG: CRISPR-associated endonuclease Cas1 [Armatimonadetes bacterium]|nr:CRISPR-associated endonuclease Cas1 [Armatimonadota bacterium]